MKRLIAFFIVSFLSILVYGETYWTFTVNITNATSENGYWIKINNSTRYSSNIITSATWLTNNNVGITTTNIFRHYGQYPMSGVICDLISSNQLVFRGFNLTFALDSRIGNFSSNSISNIEGYSLMLPIEYNAMTNRITIANDLVSAIEYATNKISKTNQALSNYASLDTTQGMTNKTLFNSSLASGTSATNLYVRDKLYVQNKTNLQGAFFYHDGGYIHLNDTMSTNTDYIALGSDGKIYLSRMAIGQTNPAILTLQDTGQIWKNNVKQDNLDNLIIALNSSSMFYPANYYILTNKGDIPVRGSTVEWLALPVGVNGQILSVDMSTPTGLRWITPTYGQGTVTNVGLLMPTNVFGITNSPITLGGNIVVTNKYQAPNTVFAGPASGSTSLEPQFRTLVSADLPAGIDAQKIGTGSVDNTEFSFLDGLTSRAVGTNELVAGANMTIVRSNGFWVWDASGSGGGSVSVNTNQFSTNSGVLAIKRGALLTNLSVDTITTYSNAIRIGQYAGANFTNTSYTSVFIGTSAGGNAANAYSSTFIGTSAGGNATNAYYSIFEGKYAGRNAANANSSTFIGTSAGENAINAYSSTFIGTSAGGNATNAYYSIFIGRYAGYNINQPYRLAIESSSSDRGTNTLIYGEFDNRYLAVNGSLQVSNVVMLRNGAARTNVEPSVTKIYSDNNGELRARRTNDTSRSVYLVNEANTINFSASGLTNSQSIISGITFPSAGTYLIIVNGFASMPDTINYCEIAIGHSAVDPNQDVRTYVKNNSHIVDGLYHFGMNKVITVNDGETSDFYYLFLWTYNGTIPEDISFDGQISIVRIK